MGIPRCEGSEFDCEGDCLRGSADERVNIKKARPPKIIVTDTTNCCTIVIAVIKNHPLMIEIDKVIEKHGGWPGAFTSMKK